MENFDSLFWENRGVFEEQILFFVKDAFIKDDILSNLYLKIKKSEKRLEYKSKKEFISYCRFAAKTLSIDYIKKEKMKFSLSSSFENPDDSDDSSGVEDYLLSIGKDNYALYEDFEIIEEKNEVLKSINEVISRLPKKQQDVLRYRYFYNYTNLEISETTGGNINVIGAYATYGRINVFREIRHDKKLNRMFCEFFNDPSIIEATADKIRKQKYQINIDKKPKYRVDNSA